MESGFTDANPAQCGLLVHCQPAATGSWEAKDCIFLGGGKGGGGALESLRSRLGIDIGVEEWPCGEERERADERGVGLRECRLEY